jgi:hypothetical protein
LYLLDERPPKGQLLVLNDSVWFPIWPDCDLLDRFRAAPEDLFGLILSDDPRDRKPAHIQSYMFRFSREALRMPAFHSFWKRLEISDDRVMTIRRCEIPMTRKLREMGLSFGAVFQTTDLAEQLRAADDELLESIVRVQIALSERRSPPLRAVLRAAQAREPTWRDQAIESIESHHAGRYLLMAHPDIVFGNLKIQVLKKSRERRYVLQRRLATDRGHVTRFLPEVADEVVEWDQGVEGMSKLPEILRDSGELKGE